MEARRIGAHVEELYERTWGLKHPFSVAAATNLAVTLRLLGLLDQARALSEKAVEDMRTTLGADHPAVTDAHFNHRMNCDIDAMQI